MGAVLLAAAVASCAPAGTAGDRSTAQPSESSSSSETAAATAHLLPRELGGVELHTFATGQDSVARLLAGVGATSLDLEIAYASDHGARFLQLYAMRVKGVDGQRLLSAFAAAAYDPEDGTIDRAEDEIRGRSVSVISQPATAQRLGTFYAYVIGDALLVAQTLDRPTAVECLAAMP